MEKILLAIDEPNAESAIEKYLGSQYEFSQKYGQYKEQIAPLIESECPDILVIKESLKGTMSFDALVHNIRSTYPQVRMVIITVKREIGDPFFKSMLKYGVYDVLSSHPAKLKDILSIIKQPKSLDYILYLSGEDKNSEEYKPMEDAPLLDVEDKDENKRETKKKGFFSSLKKETKKEEVPVIINKEPKVPVSADALDKSGNHSNPPQTEPIMNHNYGTQVLDDDENEDEKTGFIFMPYEIQPVAITDFRTGERIIVNPDGSSEKSKLPIKSGPKPLINQQFDEYARSLLLNIQNQNSIPQKTAKLTVFTAVRQGSGCSSTSLNVALSLANQGQKVLFLDACIGRSSLYARYELPLSDTDNIDKALAYLRDGENISALPLTHKKLMKVGDANDLSRFKEFPENIAFLKYSDDFNATNDSLSIYIPEFLRVYGQIYDHIIVDTTLSFFDTCTYKFLEQADSVFLVLLQDYYELTLAYDLLKSNYQKLDLLSKLGVCVNRYYRIEPVADSIQKEFQTNYLFTIPSDEKGFLKANSMGIPYYLCGKRAVLPAYDDIAESL